MKAPKLILVPIDMSAYSVAALQYAQAIAALFEANIIVIHVDERAEVAAQERDKSAELGKESESSHRIKVDLAQLLSDYDVVPQNLRIEVRHGPAVRTIVQSARHFGADLIVMSTHGRSGLRHVLMGSVAEKVVRYASCPVLTVKPEEFRELIDVTEEDISSTLDLGESVRS